MPVAIHLNGEARDVEAGSSLVDLLEELGRHPRTVAIEYNGEILKRELFAETELREGDRLEVVHFVQGG